MKQYETVIGLEVHVELDTKTKIFCSCENKFGGEPNTHCCPICTGMPGTLPVINEQVVEFAIATGIATNCRITPYGKFDRKNYFYPDLPKAYQVSQLYLPICTKGHVEIEVNGEKKSIGIHEIHMEEDAGKLVHDSWEECTLVDYNRCGVPLLEIVSEPDMRSADEVIAYLEKLKATLQYLGVSDCKLQEGSMRADINLSIRPVGQVEFGTRTEMKNMNSFKAIARAIEGERQRQIDLIEEGGEVIQQTRRWDDNKGESFAMRSKEDAQDYRYFPEPDLAPIEIDEDWIDKVRSCLPEMPDAKKVRYMKDFELSEYDTNIITGSKYLVNIFEKATDICGNAKATANMIMGDVMRMLKETSKLPEDISFSSENLAKLIMLIEKGSINRTVGREVFDKIFIDDIDPEKYVKENGLEMVKDDNLVKDTVTKIVEANPQAIEDYKAGKDKAFKFLVGQSMKELKGKADPVMINTILKEILENK
jgi:aspartyl-tRNA(Asn)/glutamyl-tRNA(Gln) amidotransferase subunit B